MEDTIFTMEKLYKAYKQCIKNKRNTTNALKFELNREQNLSKLLLDLKTGKYKISRHICFVVKNPAPREVFAGDFRDRVVQHLLCNEINYIFEEQFLDSSFANRIGKGTHRAFKRARFFITRGGLNRQRLFYLKMDIKSFFRSIHKDTLYKMIEEDILKERRGALWKREVLWLTKMIIFHDPTTDYIFKGKLWTRKLIKIEKSLFSGDSTRGLPIGNITSQFFANVYLHKMDFFIEKDLGFDRYVRYVDDFVIFHEDKELLERTVLKIENFVQDNLLMKIYQDKTFIVCVDRGLDFLGYFIKPTHTLVRKKVVRRFRFIFYNEILEKRDGLIKLENMPRLNSYIGHCIHANSFNLRSKLNCIPSQHLK